jgi:hypothetical protein
VEQGSPTRPPYDSEVPVDTRMIAIAALVIAVLLVLVLFVF